jgi:hypothetical protein
MGASGFFPVGSGADSLQGALQQIFQFQGFNEISVPNQTPVGGLNVTE